MVGKRGGGGGRKNREKESGREEGWGKRGKGKK